MRRIDDTHRVLGLVALAVTAGLAVASLANGSADAHSQAVVETSEAVGAPVSVTAPRSAAAAEPVRKVRMVYAGPIVASAEEGDQTRRWKFEEPSPSGSIGLERPAQPRRIIDATGSIGPAPPVRPAALGSDGAVGGEQPDDLVSLGLDLNRASIAELNGLGAGRIGKAIARGRPYASPEDLLRKRVLNRATYARIRDQVTVE